jgi:transcription elongation factor GreA
MTAYETVVRMTAHGLRKLQDELEQLKTTRLPKVHEELEIALSYGELDENAAYDTAKQELDLVVERIDELEYTLRHARVIEDDGVIDKVRLGSLVTIVEPDNEDEPETYRIVSLMEADPASGLISAESPIALALLNKRVGDTVKAKTPGGEMTFVIRAIA